MITGPLFFLSLYVNYYGRSSIEDNIRNICTLLLIYAVFEAVVAWLLLFGTQFSLGGQVYSHSHVWDLRLYGVAGEPSHFGSIMGIGLLCLLFQYNGKSHRITIKKILLFVFLGTSLLFSGSRNAMLSFFVSGTAFLVANKNIRILKPLFLSAFLISLIFILKPNLRNVTIVSLLHLKETTSEDIRYMKYINGIKLIYGSETNELLFGRGNDYIVSHPSFMNEYLELIVGYGFIWIIGLFILLIFLVWKYLRMLRHNRAIASFGLSLLLFSLTYFLFLAPLFKVFHIVSFIFYFSIIFAICWRRCRIPDDFNMVFP
jgi:O-antigen ligase